LVVIDVHGGSPLVFGLVLHSVIKVGTNGGPLERQSPSPSGAGLLKENDDMNVNAPAPLSGTMDVDEFMAFMETRPKEEHWDLIDGVAVMMPPATDVHQRVAYNLCRLLDDAIISRRLKLIACLALGVRSPGILNFQPRPHVVVIPGPARVNLYSTDFRLAAEVLSPSNTRREIDLKLRRYCEAPANLYAVVIDPLTFMGNIREGPQVGSDGSQASRGRDRNAGIRLELPRGGCLPRHRT
jgi:Uma2 family endonuclease